jgi:thiamine phosphate synthase YjbQ (UPF0047 family)
VGEKAQGTITITSRHTTTAICINEYEVRLVEDLRLWYSQMAPAGVLYLHNDLHVREVPGAQLLDMHLHHSTLCPEGL